MMSNQIRVQKDACLFKKILLFYGLILGLILMPVWPALALEPASSSELTHKAVSLAFSPDGKILAVGLQQALVAKDQPSGPELPASVQLFELSSGRRLASLSTAGLSQAKADDGIAPLSLAFSADGSKLAVSQILFERLSGPRGQVSIWDLNSLQPLSFESPCSRPADSIAFINQDQALLWGISLEDPAYAYNQLQSCELTSGKVLRELKNAGAALLTADQKFLISSGYTSHSPQLDWRVTILDAHTYHRLSEVEGFAPPLEVSPDGSLLLARLASQRGAQDLELGLIKIRSGALLKRLKLKEAGNFYSWLSQTELITAQYADYPANPSSIKLWDTQTGLLKRSLSLPETLTGIGLSPDKKVFVTLNQSKGLRGSLVRVWDARSFQLLKAWQI